MKSPDGVIKRWRMFVAAYAVLTSGIALMFTWLVVSSLGTYSPPDATTIGLAVLFTVLSLLLWLSVNRSGKDDPTLAGTLAIIAGIFTLPMGALLILAGMRLRAAANTTFEQWLDSQKHGSLGLD